MVHSKLLGIAKVKLAGLLLGVLTSLAAGTAYPADLPISCKVVNASTVQCGGTTCIGDITIDALGTIRCLQSVSKPTCTLTASPASISSGGTATLRASCDPAATSYVWSNGACASSAASSCTVTPSTSYTGYTVAGVNSAGTGTAAFASVTVASTNSPAPSAPAPTGPPVCNPIQSTFLGGYTRLSSNCSPVGTSYSWAGGACQGVGTENCDFTTPTATTNYSVTATNSYGAVTKNIQITVVPPLPVCTLSASKPKMGTGETSVLTANCNPQATSYDWTGGTCAGTSAASCPVTPATTTAYTVAGINANGTGAAAGVTVDVDVPVCSASAGPLVDAGAYVTTTLTASCDRAVTQYNWTAAAGLVAGTNTATVTLPKAPLGTTTYNVNGQNGSSSGANAAVSVNVAMPSCTVTASPTTINTGGTSTLTASCTPAASSYSWTGPAGLTAGTNTATFTTSVAATYNFSVTGSNAVGPGAVSANAAVTVSAAPVVPTSCTIIDVTWPAGGVNFYVQPFTPTQTMNTGQMFAFRVRDLNLSTLSLSTSYAQLGYASPGINHYLNVSANPCEFTAEIENVGCSSSGLTEPRFIYSTTGAAGAACKISSGTTWYFNVKNAASRDGADTCPAGQSCTYTFNW